MYTSAQVIEITGVSYRRLVYWISQGFIPGQLPVGEQFRPTTSGSGWGPAGRAC